MPSAVNCSVGRRLAVSPFTTAAGPPRFRCGSGTGFILHECMWTHSFLLELGVASWTLSRRTWRDNLGSSSWSATSTSLQAARLVRGVGRVAPARHDLQATGAGSRWPCQCQPHRPHIFEYHSAHTRTLQCAGRCELFQRHAASDHRAVVLSIRRKCSSRAGQISSYISRHEAPRDEMLLEMQSQEVPTRYCSAYAVLGRSGRSVQHRVRRAVVRARDSPPGVLAEVCMRALRPLSSSKEAAAARILAEIPALASCADGNTVFAPRVRRRLRQHLDAQPCHASQGRHTGAPEGCQEGATSTAPNSASAPATSSASAHPVRRGRPYLAIAHRLRHSGNLSSRRGRRTSMRKPSFSLTFTASRCRPTGLGLVMCGRRQSRQCWTVRPDRTGCATAFGPTPPPLRRSQLGPRPRHGSWIALRP